MLRVRERIGDGHLVEDFGSTQGQILPTQLYSGSRPTEGILTCLMIWKSTAPMMAIQYQLQLRNTVSLVFGRNKYENQQKSDINH